MLSLLHLDVGICDDKIECRHHFIVSNQQIPIAGKKESENLSAFLGRFFHQYYFFRRLSWQRERERELGDRFEFMVTTNINTIQPLNKQVSAISTWKRDRVWVNEWVWDEAEKTNIRIFEILKFQLREYDAGAHWSISHKGKREILSLNFENEDPTAYR